MAIRVAVIDGHTLTRYGLAGLFGGQSDIELVGEADTAATAARMVMIDRPDVVTVDVELPDGDGLELAGRLRACRPELGIVVLASRGDDAVLFRALRAGRPPSSRRPRRSTRS